ncbi:MAG: ATP-binding cassette domain-containing protein [Shimia sp.]|nr:ATP-binding cassette domain-containing protein [Shimia sp.]
MAARGATRPTPATCLVQNGHKASRPRQSAKAPASPRCFSTVRLRRGTSKRRAGQKADIAGLLPRVGVADALDRRMDSYSKGMRHRQGLAQVLLGKLKPASLDEPTSGLDPISRQNHRCLRE